MKVAIGEARTVENSSRRFFHNH